MVTVVTMVDYCWLWSIMVHHRCQWYHGWLGKMELTITWLLNLHTYSTLWHHIEAFVSLSLPIGSQYMYVWLIISLFHPLMVSLEQIPVVKKMKKKKYNYHCCDFNKNIALFLIPQSLTRNFLVVANIFWVYVRGEMSNVLPKWVSFSQ